jgi:DNA mismatch endonuclease (patch repair protein)
MFGTRALQIRSMTDRLTPAERSALMSRVRGKDTRPELAVRRLLHGLGFRFRLHRRDLPGTPDLVLPKYNAVVMVHGCFWHGHRGCKAATVPKTRTDYWLEKIAANRRRDARDSRRLRRLGWKVVVVWQCETKNSEALQRLGRSFSEKLSDSAGAESTSRMRRAVEASTRRK